MRKEGEGTIADVVSRIFPVAVSTTYLELAVRIAEKCLGKKDPDLVSNFMDPRKFSVGEYCPRFNLNGKKSLEGKSVYVMLFPNPHKDPGELMDRAFKTAYAAKSNGAKKVVLLTTDLPYARQDRGPEDDEKAAGELNIVELCAKSCLISGIDEVITTHEHSPRIPAFFAKAYGLVDYDANPNNQEVQEEGRKIFKSISPHCVLADYLLHHSSLKSSGYLDDEGKRLVLKAVDQGNANFIENLQKALFLENSSIIFCSKVRSAKNDPDKVDIDILRTSDNFETLDGALELYADDGLDTGGTMIKSTKWSRKGNLSNEMDYGTPAEQIIYFTHAWLGGKAYEQIQEKIIKAINPKEILTTNTRPYIDNSQYYRFKYISTVLRLANLWGDAILANELGENVSKRYVGFSSEQEQHNFLKNLYERKRHSKHFLNVKKTEMIVLPDFYLRD